ncbi:hypothetical protein GCM10023159_01210 [Brevibacterium yomogidense]
MMSVHGLFFSAGAVCPVCGAEPAGPVLASVMGAALPFVMMHGGCGTAEEHEEMYYSARTRAGRHRGPT